MAGLSPYRSRARTDDPARDFGKQLEVGIANSQVREETFSTVSSGTIRHSLRRAYVGAIVVGQSGTSVSIRVVHPESATDAREAVNLTFSAPFTGTVRVLVF